MNKILKQNYFDASLPGSLSGFQSFSRALKERGVIVAPEKIKEFLRSEPTYSRRGVNIKEIKLQVWELIIYGKLI